MNLTHKMKIMNPKKPIHINKKIKNKINQILIMRMMKITKTIHKAKKEMFPQNNLKEAIKHKLLIQKKNK